MELKPGIKALTLPHPMCCAAWTGLVVEVLSAPVHGSAWVGPPPGRFANVVFCEIRRTDGVVLNPGSDLKAGWIAAALLPLPGDEEFKNEKLSVPVKDALKKLAESDV